MCGSPVVLCAKLDQGWQAGIVGMVLRGGPAMVHFLDTFMLLAHAQKFVEMLPPGS
jgi:hypothetical protein